MDDKYVEIAVLAATNVISLIVVVVLNILACYYSRNEDPEQTFRKYTVQARAPSSSLGPVGSHSAQTEPKRLPVMGNKEASTKSQVTSNHGRSSDQGPKRQHGERSEKRHS